MNNGTSLVVQWLRLQTPNTGDTGLIPGQGKRAHMAQLKFLHAASKTPHSTMKVREPACHSQRNR